MKATVRISPRLAVALGDLSKQLAEGGSMRLLLRPEGDVATAERGLLAAVLEVQDDFAEAGEASDELDPSDTGEWDWMTVSAGLLIVIRESNALEAVLDAVVAALERNDVSGIFEHWDPVPIRDLPLRSPLIACRLRIGGRRLDDDSWQVDVADRGRVIAAADRWCRNGVSDGSPALLARTDAWVGADAAGDMVTHLVAGADQGLRSIVANVGSTVLRAFAAYANGGLVLVSGGEHIETAEWQPELAELTELLRGSADQLAYGYIFRGWDIVGAVGDGLATDWPLRTGTSDYSERPAADVEQANDIFGVQLLGPGYPDCLPVVADWHVEQAGTAARLLSHTDPSAWFSAPFVPTGQRLPVQQRLAPPILRQARDEFAAILSPTPSV